MSHVSATFRSLGPDHLARARPFSISWRKLRRGRRRSAAPSLEEQEFLDTLRRIVARSAAEDLWCRYHSARAYGE